MATTITTSIVSYYNEAPQQLYSITDPLQNGVPQFVAGESTAVLTFDNYTSERGSDITVDGATGQVTVQGDISYLFTARCDTTSKTPTLIRLEESSSGQAFGAPARAGETLSVMVSPADENDYQIVAYTADGSRFQYPDSIVNATLVVQAANGYTVA